MRMIGIGLMGFLLAGVALLLSTMNIVEQGQRYIREAARGPQLVFEHRTAAPAQDAQGAVISRANPDHPVILSGIPAYQSVAFNMPMDARPTSGYLQVDATSQVLEGVEGVLRISIHNTRRGEMLLRSGEVGRSLQIPLSPEDFAGDKLVVSFSLQGAGPHQRCGPQHGVEAVVEIETTSAVYLTLDQPLQSVRDQVHAWGNVVHVAWPAWLKQDEQLRRLVLATQFQRRGLATMFDAGTEVQDALTTVDLRTALSVFPEVEVQPNGPGYLAQSGQNAGLRRFYRQVTWRKGFALDAGGGGHLPSHLPSHLDLHILFGRLIGDQSWAVTVTLNERLVFQDHIAGSQTAFHALIDLPADIQGARNTVEVIATTTARQNGVCDQGPELVAEMLPESRFLVGEVPFADTLSDLHAALGGVEMVNVAMTAGLTGIDADRASRLLDQVIPAGTAIKPAGTKAQVTVLSPGHPLPPVPETGAVWVVTSDQTTQGLSVVPLYPGDVLPRVGLGLLVTPGSIPAGEVQG